MIGGLGLMQHVQWDEQVHQDSRQDDDEDIPFEILFPAITTEHKGPIK